MAERNSNDGENGNFIGTSIEIQIEIEISEGEIDAVGQRGRRDLDLLRHLRIRYVDFDTSFPVV